MTLEIQILAWDRHKNVVGLTSQWDPNLPLDDNRVFPMEKYICMQASNILQINFTYTF